MRAALFLFGREPPKIPCWCLFSHSDSATPTARNCLCHLSAGKANSSHTKPSADGCNPPFLFPNARLPKQVSSIQARRSTMLLCQSILSFLPLSIGNRVAPPQLNYVGSPSVDCDENVETKCHKIYNPDTTILSLDAKDECMEGEGKRLDCLNGHPQGRPHAPASSTTPPLQQSPPCLGSRPGEPAQWLSRPSD